jgi:hypothetical protein
MSASHERYTRRQGLRKTYDVEYTNLRYQITLDGKLLKQTKLPVGALDNSDAVWQSTVSDIEYLRGMPEE